MEELEIRVVGADDAQAIDDWYAAYRASDTYRRPAASPWRRREIGARLRPSTSRWWGAWSGVLDDEVVAAGFVELYLKDNQHLAQVEVHVLPGSRRRGFGSVMLARLEGEARSRGRRTAFGDVGVPLDGPEDGRGGRRCRCPASCSTGWRPRRPRTTRTTGSSRSAAPPPRRTSPAWPPCRRPCSRRCRPGSWSSSGRTPRSRAGASGRPPSPPTA